MTYTEFVPIFPGSINKNTGFINLGAGQWTEFLWINNSILEVSLYKNDWVFEDREMDFESYLTLIKDLNG